jgi:hypothetical protein
LTTYLQNNARKLLRIVALASSALICFISAIVPMVIGTVVGSLTSPFTGPIYGESVSVNKLERGIASIILRNELFLSEVATADGIER